MELLFLHFDAHGYVLSVGSQNGLIIDIISIPALLAQIIIVFFHLHHRKGTQDITEEELFMKNYNSQFELYLHMINHQLIKCYKIPQNITTLIWLSTK